MGPAGNGFLYNMVRIIVGTLLEAGLGKREPDEIPGILEALDRSAAGPTAPACGLSSAWDASPAALPRTFEHGYPPEVSDSGHRKFFRPAWGCRCRITELQ